MAGKENTTPDIEDDAEFSEDGVIDHLAQFKTDGDFFKHMENLEKEALAELEAEGVPIKDD
jgi:hypothetical protein